MGENMIESTTPDLSELLTIADFERAARALLSKEMFATILGSVGGEFWRTNTNNVRAFADLPIRPRVMTGVGERDLSTTLLGTPVALPILAAPTGSHQRVHADGELATARGTHGAGAAMILSTVANYSIEEVAAASEGPLWFQSYVFRDRVMSADLLQRAEAAGYKAIVLTVDNVSGRLDHNERARKNNYSFADEVKTSRTLTDERILRNLQKYETNADGERFQRQALRDMFDPTLSWADLEWVRTVTTLPIVVKGIQTAEDAVLAVAHGASAIIVSNHGGTSVETDGQPASLSVLPEVIAAVGDAIEVYVDGGVRHGGDVLKALALGARAVLIGRAELFGLTVGGAEGVAKVFDILARELDAYMGLCGVQDVKQVNRSIVGDVPGVTTDVLRERMRHLHAEGFLTDEMFAASQARILRTR